MTLWLSVLVGLMVVLAVTLWLVVWVVVGLRLGGMVALHDGVRVMAAVGVREGLGVPLAVGGRFRRVVLVGLELLLRLWVAIRGLCPGLKEALQCLRMRPSAKQSRQEGQDRCKLPSTTEACHAGGRGEGQVFQLGRSRTKCDRLRRQAPQTSCVSPSDSEEQEQPCHHKVGA